MKITNDLYDAIQQEVEAGFVQKQTLKHLAHYTYTREATQEWRWNKATRACRGLILNETNRDIVALPFDKFFNYEEMDKKSLPLNMPHEVTVKEDGVLGISYYDGGEMKIATRMGMETPKSLVGLELFRKLYRNVQLPRHLTFCFEIICADTHIHVKYDREAMICIGIRDLNDGRDYTYNEMAAKCLELGIEVVKRYPYDMFTCLSQQSTWHSQEEGVVVRFENGLRIKIKSDDYCAAVRIRKFLSNKTIARLWLEDRVREVIGPLEEDHILDFVYDKLGKLDEVLNAKWEATNQAWREIPANLDQKSFALLVKSRYNDVAPLLFDMRKGSNVYRLIKEWVAKNYKEIWRDMEKEIDVEEC